MPNECAHSSLEPNNPGASIANLNITLRQLRAFLAVAEELSFSRAAERLVVSTPWISETIKELERQLKVTLFVRTTRSVQLTDAGRVFASLLSHVLDDLDDAVRVAQRMTARSGRALTLGYVIGAGLELVPRLVRTYLERWPELGSDQDAIIDLIYTEFVLREQRGEKPVPADFERRFPALAGVLRKQLDVHRALAERGAAEAAPTLVWIRY